MIKQFLVCSFCFSNSLFNKTNIFHGLTEYEPKSLLGASHLVDYISVHIRFDLERCLLTILRVLMKISEVSKILLTANNTTNMTKEDVKIIFKSMLVNVQKL